MSACSGVSVWHDNPMTAVRNAADVAAAIIAGGKASRLGGQVKALIEIEGRSILERMLDVLTPRVAAIVISANDPTPYQDRGLIVIPDGVLDQGPLAGLAAALGWCRRPYLLAVACDMPYLQPGVVDLLLSRRAPGVDIIAPFIDDAPEPLCALYSPSVLPVLQRRLQSGQLKAADLVTDSALNLCRVYEPELRKVDPALQSFTNLNTPDDLAQATLLG